MPNAPFIEPPTVSLAQLAELCLRKSYGTPTSQK